MHCVRSEHAPIRRTTIKSARWGMRARVRHAHAGTRAAPPAACSGSCPCARARSAPRTAACACAWRAAPMCGPGGAGRGACACVRVRVCGVHCSMLVRRPMRSWQRTPSPPCAARMRACAPRAAAPAHPPAASPTCARSRSGGGRPRPGARCVHAFVAQRAAWACCVPILVPVAAPHSQHWQPQQWCSRCSSSAQPPPPRATHSSACMSSSGPSGSSGSSIWRFACTDWRSPDRSGGSATPSVFLRGHRSQPAQPPPGGLHSQQHLLLAQKAAQCTRLVRHPCIQCTLARFAAPPTSQARFAAESDGAQSCARSMLVASNMHGPLILLHALHPVRALRRVVDPLGGHLRGRRRAGACWHASLRAHTCPAPSGCATTHPFLPLDNWARPVQRLRVDVALWCGGPEEHGIPLPGLVPART